MASRPGSSRAIAAVLPPTAQHATRRQRRVITNSRWPRRRWITNYSIRSWRHTRFLIQVGLALDLDLHSGIDQPFHLDQRGGRQMVAEIRDSARVDFGPFRNVGHEDLHLDDVFRSGAGRPEAFVHRPDSYIELGDNVGRDAPVLRLPYDTSDPDVGAGTSDVAIV